MDVKIIYFSGLNGLRAIAALAVVISHTTLALKAFNLSPFIFGVAKDGTPKGLILAGYGVTIFFVLSGFLITYLLQAEKDIQEINIKKFYVRRILRIWPLYYLYLIICVAVMLLYKHHLDIKVLLLYIFYAANIPFILGNSFGFLAHYWSLGVEEQFYLFWPWVNKKLNNRVIIPIITLVIVLLIGIKIGVHFLYPHSIINSAIHFHCMIIGGLGAILYKRKNTLFLRITDNKLSQIICWLVIFLLAINKFHIASIIDGEIICIVSLTLIIGQIQIKNRIINLETNVLDFLGKISYGMYVTHPILIFFLVPILNAIPIQNFYKYLLVYFSVLSTTIAVSYLSYNYFEKYFLSWKHRFIVIDSASSKHFR